MVILGKKIKSFENPIFVKVDVERVMIYKIQTHSKTTLNIFAKIKQIYMGYTLFAKEGDFKLYHKERGWEVFDISSVYII